MKIDLLNLENRFSEFTAFTYFTEKKNPHYKWTHKFKLLSFKGQLYLDPKTLIWMFCVFKKKI